MAPKGLKTYRIYVSLRTVHYSPGKSEPRVRPFGPSGSQKRTEINATRLGTIVFRNNITSSRLFCTLHRTPVHRAPYCTPPCTQGHQTPRNSKTVAKTRPQPSQPDIHPRLLLWSGALAYLALKFSSVLESRMPHRLPAAAQRELGHTYRHELQATPILLRNGKNRSASLVVGTESPMTAAPPPPVSPDHDLGFVLPRSAGAVILQVLLPASPAAAVNIFKGV